MGDGETGAGQTSTKASHEALGSLESIPESRPLVFFVNCVLHILYISLANKHMCLYMHLFGKDH